ncbi:MAG: hypothetical protein GY859_15045, partial [Desulfobacterales bacterium]|nr:hypothetical protein [Desulfobacterales bacterium]
MGSEKVVRPAPGQPRWKAVIELATIPFHSFEKSVTEALDAIDARDRIAGRPRVLIKPNLVTDSPHPITTSPG